MDALVVDASGIAAAAGEPSRGDAALIAMALHGWYNAVEQTLERIAVAFEGSVPRGSDSHRALLRGMTLDLADVRPPVLRKQTEAELAELLKFRHFFRHAYSTDLDVAKLRENVAHLERAHPLLVEDLDAVVAAIDALVIAS